MHKTKLAAAIDTATTQPRTLREWWAEGERLNVVHCFLPLAVQQQFLRQRRRHSLYQRRTN